MKTLGVFAGGAIWFGAAISIAEIEAGRQMGGNWPALVGGHLFGGLLLFGAGLAGARTRCGAMESARQVFGSWGAKFFAALNILQLVGWTAVMVAQGAEAVCALSGVEFWICCVALAVMTAMWQYVGGGNAPKASAMCVGLMAVLCLMLSVKFRMAGTGGAAPSDEMAFWSAFEISAAMPLSWLPLVADYTKDARRPVAVSAASATAYTMASVWMFAMGFALARAGCEGFVGGVLRLGAKFGRVGLAVVVLSTVTTTFLDATSAGMSAGVFSRKFPPRTIGSAVCLLGAALAVSGAMAHYMGFLYLVASVFAPMAAVLLIDRFLAGRASGGVNFVAWLSGFLLYQFAGASPVGPTLTAMGVSALLTFVGKRVNGRFPLRA